MQIPFGVKVQESPIMLKGYQALKRRGQVVWLGPIGAPIEDAEFDCVCMHPDDYDRLVTAISNHEGDVR